MAPRDILAEPLAAFLARVRAITRIPTDTTRYPGMPDTRYHAPKRRPWSLSCLKCGSKLNADNGYSRTAQYCSEPCRVAAWREKTADAAMQRRMAARFPVIRGGKP